MTRRRRRPDPPPEPEQPPLGAGVGRCSVRPLWARSVDLGYIAVVRGGQMESRGRILAGRLSLSSHVVHASFQRGHAAFKV
jgi:hypothetical protein